MVKEDIIIRIIKSITIRLVLELINGLIAHNTWTIEVVAPSKWALLKRKTWLRAHSYCL